MSGADNVDGTSPRIPEFILPVTTPVRGLGNVANPLMEGITTGERLALIHSVGRRGNEPPRHRHRSLRAGRRHHVLPGGNGVPGVRRRLRVPAPRRRALLSGRVGDGLPADGIHTGRARTLCRGNTRPQCGSERRHRAARDDRSQIWRGNHRSSSRGRMKHAKVSGDAPQCFVREDPCVLPASSTP